MDVVRAGWLWRQSSFLKRWKRSWFAMTQDGYMRMFESPDSMIAKKTIFVPKEVMAIKIGLDVDSKAPEGYANENMLKIIGKEATWVLCADSLDEMIAWQLALEQARALGRQPQQRPNYNEVPPYVYEIIENNPNNGYPMYYRGSYNGRYPSRIVHTAQGPITVVYVDDPYYRRYYSRDIALGALAGTAVASTLFWPFWFPFFWC